MPSKFFLKIKSKITPIQKTAFLSSFIFGIAAHLYKMTNWLPNWDSLVFRKDPQHMEPLGRWFLSFASKISSDYELPWINGLLAVIYISAATVIICEMFNIKSRMCALLIGAVTVTFPTVISTFMYCYVADAYALSFLLACTAAYLLARREKLCAVASVILLALAMGIYQAYVTVTIALLTAGLIVGLTFNGESAACSLKKALKYIICGIAAIALYYGIQSAVTSLFNISVSDYQGVSDTFSFKKISLTPAVNYCLYSFYRFFINFKSGFNLYSAVNILCFSAIGAGWLYAILKNVRGFALIVISLYIISVPFGCSALYFANPDLDYHTIMKMGYFAAYVYLIILYEKLSFKNGILSAVTQWTVLLLCTLVVFSNTVTANIAYHKLGISYEKSYGILIKISDRIEKLENYKTANKILTVGALRNSERYSVDFPPEITGTTDGLIIRRDDETVNQSVLASALKDYCDIDLDFISGKAAQELKSSETVKNMPCWPAEGSVAPYGNIVIVKLSEK